MIMRDGVLGFTLVCVLALGAGPVSANDNDRNDGSGSNKWAGFYGGVNGGFEVSKDSNDITAIDPKFDANDGSKDVTGSAFVNGQTGNNSKSSPFAIEIGGP